MLSMLQAWSGKVEVNGVLYENMGQILPHMVENDNLNIKLYPVTETSQNKAEEKVFGWVDVVVNSGEYRITVKQYMTKPASPEFDFMMKWNNNNPMPLRTMQGTKEKETRGMVYMHLHGVGIQDIYCMRCGRKLTHPVSRHYGIGPECMSKLGIMADIEDVENIKEQLVNVEWEGWIIKSAITEEEEVI